MSDALHIVSTCEKPWTRGTLSPGAGVPHLRVTGDILGPWYGMGGCFNEQGWEALLALEEGPRLEVLRRLFDPQADDSCRLAVGRVPIGASDYALQWYSHNETAGDLAMAHFAIDRDRQYLLPYVKAALALRPDLLLFASPWSPPTWMKHPPVYNYGTLVWTPENRRAYAAYFVRFVQAYAEAGVRIAQVHPQNEPVADQKFPSCLWTGEQLRGFIRDDLAPALREAGLEAEVWLGTLNTDDFNSFILPLATDAGARAAIAGVGLQWAGKGMAQRIARAFPDLPLMQTENECGDGRNTWAYAEYVFGLLHHYLTNGTSAYVYWNMILPPGGKSTWGWPQNAMITVDKGTGAVTYNPEYYLMRHVGRFAPPRSRRLVLDGAWSSNALGFLTPAEETVLVVHNPLPLAQECVISANGVLRVAALPPASFSTVVLPG